MFEQQFHHGHITSLGSTYQRRSAHCEHAVATAVIAKRTVGRKYFQLHVGIGAFLKQQGRHLHRGGYILRRTIRTTTAWHRVVINRGIEWCATPGIPAIHIGTSLDQIKCHIPAGIQGCHQKRRDAVRIHLIDGSAMFHQRTRTGRAALTCSKQQGSKSTHGSTLRPRLGRHLPLPLLLP